MTGAPTMCLIFSITSFAVTGFLKGGALCFEPGLTRPAPPPPPPAPLFLLLGLRMGDLSLDWLLTGLPLLASWPPAAPVATAPGSSGTAGAACGVLQAQQAHKMKSQHMALR
jgi:hypothetical protein